MFVLESKVQRIWNFFFCVRWGFELRVSRLESKHSTLKPHLQSENLKILMSKGRRKSDQFALPLFMFYPSAQMIV
jgi:hypothetical protein